jgi:pantoate--beta-alanine ligase
MSIAIITNNMSSQIEIVRTISGLRRKISSWRQDNFSIGLVPTMGALHDGHFSLVKQSINTTDKTIATLFVNPKQFGLNEDLTIYPRDEAGDAEALDALGVDLLFAPSLMEMYPIDFATEISVPGIGDVMEGAFRPGFFIGVVTVVAKLLIQSLPDRAFFGEKDLQQLYIIRKMVTDLDIPVEIVGCPIIRESDGLALSSRNVYLSADERVYATELYRVLNQILQSALIGKQISVLVKDAKTRLLNSGFSKVDYLAVCNTQNFKEVDYLTRPAHVLGAAWVGETRLIDNIQIC